jgi:PiT family inorganic phosphate transporter
MVDVVSSEPLVVRPNLDNRHNWIAVLIFLGLLAGGVGFSAYSLHQDIEQAGTPITTWMPFLLLGVALLIALGFEFVNGFQDTANAVATVIYTHSMPATWSGRASSISWVSCCRRAPSPSASFRCCRSS